MCCTAPLIDSLLADRSALPFDRIDLAFRIRIRIRIEQQCIESADIEFLLSRNSSRLVALSAALATHETSCSGD